jgi:excisionase family DNA binding protein
MVLNFSRKTGFVMKPCRKSRLYRVREAVRYLDGAITEGTMRQWIFHRKISVVRIGARVCIPQDALDQILTTGRTEAQKRSAL